MGSDDTKYDCCCGAAHVKTGAYILATVHLLSAVLLMGSVFGFFLHVAIALSIIYALRTERHSLLWPAIVAEVIIIVGLLTILVGFGALYATAHVKVDNSTAAAIYDGHPIPPMAAGSFGDKPQRRSLPAEEDKEIDQIVSGNDMGGNLNVTGDNATQPITSTESWFPSGVQGNETTVVDAWVDRVWENTVNWSWNVDDMLQMRFAIWAVISSLLLILATVHGWLLFLLVRCQRYLKDRRSPWLLSKAAKRRFNKVRPAIVSTKKRQMLDDNSLAYYQICYLRSNPFY